VNRRRSWLGLVVVACVAWIAGWAWHYATTCSLIGMSGHRAITCRWETTGAGGVSVVSRTAPALPVLWDMVARTIGVPAGVIIVGLAVYWVIESLRRRTQ
jgi:hypothetical protein